MGREGRDYWEEQLSEYWDSGLTIQEYSELKELPYESTRYLPSHPHTRSQESKIFGRVFLPLNASGRIFRLGSVRYFAHICF